MSPFTGNDLKRIAEAADGLRGYGKHWVAVNPHNLREVRVSNKGSHHRSGWIEMEVDTPAHEADLRQAEEFRIDRDRGSKQVVEIVIKHSDGTETQLYAKPPKGDTSSPKWVDALFFSPSAVDKFVLPYLASVYDAEIAKQEHDSFVKGWINGSIPFLCHAPPTVFYKC